MATATTTASSSIVKQIERLREFCGSEWSESSLLDALRRSAFNADRAAEFLLMGGGGKHQTSGQAGGSGTGSRTFDSANHRDTSTSHAKGHGPSARQTLKSKSGSGTKRRSVISHEPVNLSAPHESSWAASAKTNNVWSGYHDIQWYLLCRRWISDAYNTTKNGWLQHEEKVSLRSNPKNEKSVRFHGRQMEGYIPLPFLSPFLATVQNQFFVKVEAKALMTMERAATGVHVPFEITVYVSEEFFQLTSTKSSSARLLEDTDQRFMKRHDQSLSSSTGPNPETLSRVAFDLLQWAEYGTVPATTLVKCAAKSKTIANGNTNVGSTGKSEPKRFHDPQLTRTMTNDDTDDEKSNPENDKNIDDEEDENTDETKTGALLVSNFHGSDLPEEPEPQEGFHATLRSYQKQALGWMLLRESGEERPGTAWLQELQCLLEGGDGSPTRTDSSSQQYAQKGDTECDCGPVRVSRELWGKFPQHPQFKCRFLLGERAKRVRAFYVHELLQEAKLEAPRPPQPCSGGILADSMGLGKTVMLLALMVKSPGRTLVVAKLSLLPQWEDEITTKTDLSCAIYYGSRRVIPPDADVVITTYGTLQASHEESELFQTSWHRVILDEAHCIRNVHTGASRACCKLQSRHRWCVTGTIIQNSLDDIFGLVKFLRHEPVCLGPVWKTLTASNDQRAMERVRCILQPILLRRTQESLQEGTLSLPPIDSKVIQVDLSYPEREFYQSLLKRSQNIFDGIAHQGTSHMIQIFCLLQRLRQSCDHICLTMQTRFKENLANGAVNDLEENNEDDSDSRVAIDAIGKNFMSDLLEKFLASNPKKRSHTDQNDDDCPNKRHKYHEYISQVAEALKLIVSNPKAKSLKDECSICLEPPQVEDAVLTSPCAHIFCRHCLSDYFDKQLKESQSLICPNCNGAVTKESVIALSRSADGSITSKCCDITAERPSLPEKPPDVLSARQILDRAMTNGMESAKMLAILAELQNVWNEDPGSKVLIYSHYLGFLDLIETRLHKDGITCFRLDGSLSLKERMTVLDNFRSSRVAGHEKQGSVLLMSITAGAEGLNLVAASTCFICDPWWNQAKEDQCIHRIHRIGQTASVVRVRKFIVKHSVEERIVELQKRKKDMANNVYNGGDTEGNAHRLGLEDLRFLFQRDGT